MRGSSRKTLFLQENRGNARAPLFINIVLKRKEI